MIKNILKIIFWDSSWKGHLFSLIMFIGIFIFSNSLTEHWTLWLGIAIGITIKYIINDLDHKFKIKLMEANMNLKKLDESNKELEEMVKEALKKSLNKK